MGTSATLSLDQATPTQLRQWERELTQRYQDYKKARYQLDLTRGKPNPEQLDLSTALDGILQGQFHDTAGADLRNYGGLDGIPAAKQLFADIIGVHADEILVGGNSSLSMMYTTAQFCMHYSMNGAIDGDHSAWSSSGQPVKFLAPVPGYDRHFNLCRLLGIELIPIPLNNHGPALDQAEALVKQDPMIKGIWCVPRFSNPTGIVYSDDTVARLAELPHHAGPQFKIFWDNAYAVHAFSDNAPQVANMMDACRQCGTEDAIYLFGSTSKMTYPGAGVAYMGCSKANLACYKKRLGCTSIGPDKLNQQRHVLLFKDKAGIHAHMRQHAAIIRPRFDAVLNCLDQHLKDAGMGTWTRPEGGYFISFNTLPGLAKQVVTLTTEAGIKLTPAGAPFPYGKDPEDSTIRLAPTFPSVSDVKQAMEVFVVCIQLASVRQRLANLTGSCSPSK